jgi:hypothetical protein
MTTATLTQDTDAIEQMAQAADETIAELEQACTNIDKQIADLHTEQVTLDQAQDTRVTQLIEKRASVTSRENEYNLAMSYAKLAHGTSNEHRAVKDVSQQKKAYQAAKKEFDTLERETIEANQTGAVRAADIDKQIHLLQFEKETHQGEIESVQIGRRKVYAELGKQRYEALLSTYRDKQSVVDACQEQLITAQTDLLDFHQHAVKELAAWHDLQKSMASYIPVDDSTTRMISGTMAYIDTILQDANQVRTDFPSASFRPWDLLIIPEQQLRGFHSELEKRQKDLQRLLADYQAYLATTE